MVEDVCKKITSKYNQLINSEGLSFRHSIPYRTGVYAIFEGNSVLYVGSAVDLNRRVKHDLIGCMGQIAQPHTFGRKLMQKFKDKEAAKRYLRKSCKLKICITESLQEARVLEQLAILLLKPEYNV